MVYAVAQKSSVTPTSSMSLTTRGRVAGEVSIEEATARSMVEKKRYRKIHLADVWPRIGDTLFYIMCLNIYIGCVYIFSGVDHTNYSLVPLQVLHAPTWYVLTRTRRVSVTTSAKVFEPFRPPP